MKQSRVITEYEKLNGIKNGGNKKTVPNNSVLKQEDIAKQLGVSVIPYRISSVFKISHQSSNNLWKLVNLIILWHMRESLINED